MAAIQLEKEGTLSKALASNKELEELAQQINNKNRVSSRLLDPSIQ